VEGFAPTSRAAQKLGEAGIESSTLQRHLTRSEELHDGQKRLHVLDESSLASTKQINEFLHRLKENDRVLVHVDTEQAGEKLVNRRLAYVAISRGRYDAQIYTNDKGHLAEQLSRDVSHRSAMEPGHAQQPAQKIEPSAPSQIQPVAPRAQSIGR
jgi:ATP-dependent exoDNAse (exonuclease V) alpha subunit